MNSPDYIYGVPSIIYTILVAICLVFPIILWGKRRKPGAKELLSLYMALFFWSIRLILESSSTQFEGKLFWSQVAYVGTVFAPLLFFSFAQAFTKQFWIKKRWLWVLVAFIPLVILILSWTNESHHLIWPKITITENHMAIYDHGPAFWVFFVYSYILLLSALLLLFSYAFKIHSYYRSQSIILVVGVSITIGGNILYLLPSNPIPGMEWTLVGIIFTTILLAYGVFFLKLFNLVPIARTVVVETMSEGVLVIDAAGLISDINPSFSHLFSLDGKEILGTQYSKSLTTCPNLIEVIKSASSSQAGKRAIIHFKKRVLDVRCTDLKHRNEKGGKLLVINDITAIKQTEVALKKSNDLLSKEIEVRQKLINELDAYAHTVAHDLKIPLSGLIGFADLLYDDLVEKDYDNVMKYSLQIQDSAESMIHIINELLLLSSVRSQKVVAVSFDMYSCYTRAKKRINELISSSQVKFIEPDTWPIVFGYSPWIEEVWVNYLSNAIKYGGTPPIIHVGFDATADKIKFSVKDNGPGLDQHHIKELFKPYSRLSDSKSEGQGLGLSIVKRIMDRLNGDVGYELGQSQEGSAFYFTLPVHPTDLSDPSIH